MCRRYSNKRKRFGRFPKNVSQISVFLFSVTPHVASPAESRERLCYFHSRCLRMCGSENKTKNRNIRLDGRCIEIGELNGAAVRQWVAATNTKTEQPYVKFEIRIDKRRFHHETTHRFGSCRKSHWQYMLQEKGVKTDWEIERGRVGQHEVMYSIAGVSGMHRNDCEITGTARMWVFLHGARRTAHMRRTNDKNIFFPCSSIVRRKEWNWIKKYILFFHIAPEWWTE